MAGSELVLVDVQRPLKLHASQRRFTKPSQAKPVVVEHFGNVRMRGSVCLFIQRNRPLELLSCRSNIAQLHQHATEIVGDRAEPWIGLAVYSIPDRQGLIESDARLLISRRAEEALAHAIQQHCRSGHRHIGLLRIVHRRQRMRKHGRARRPGARVVGVEHEGAVHQPQGFVRAVGALFVRQPIAGQCADNAVHGDRVVAHVNQRVSQQGRDRFIQIDRVADGAGQGVAHHIRTVGQPLLVEAIRCHKGEKIQEVRRGGRGGFKLAERNFQTHRHRVLAFAAHATAQQIGPVPLEPPHVIGEADPRMFDQRRRLFQGQRQIAERLRQLPHRQHRILPTGTAAQKENRLVPLERLNREDAADAAPVRVTAGDDHMPARRHRHARRHRIRIRRAVENQQPLAALFQLTANGLARRLGVPVLRSGKKFTGQNRKIMGQCRFVVGSNPPHHRVFLAMSMRVFQSYLRLADSRHPDQGLCMGMNITAAQSRVQFCEDFFATCKMCASIQRNLPDRPGRFGFGAAGQSNRQILRPGS